MNQSRLKFAGQSLFFGVNRKQHWFLILTLCVAMFLGAPPHRAGAVDYPLVMTIENNSGFSDTDIYLLCIGQNDTGSGYLDMATNTFINATSFGKDDIAAMTTKLSDIKKGLNRQQTYSIIVPGIISGRFYFSFGDNFDQCPNFSVSGPTNGPENTVVYDKFELDTWGTPFINVTDVDFFGVSYYLTVTDTTGKEVKRGFLTSREDVFATFENMAGYNYPFYGNTGIFEALSINRTVKDDVTRVRVLAPKNPGYSDFNTSLGYAQQKSSHFFDQYVNNHCWQPNRTFSFYSKLHKPSDPDSDKTIYYGKVSADGMTLNLFTDDKMTMPYTVASLPRPSSSNALFPQIPGEWHQTDSASPDSIDWGFVLGGQTPATNWASTDPVVMAITTAIVRGVMHYEDGCKKWTDSALYYQGDNGISTADYPIYYYAKLIHDLSIENLAYALSFDDVYGSDPSVTFRGGLTLTFNAVKPVSQARLSVSEKNLWVGTESDTTTFSVSNTGTAGTSMVWTAEVTYGQSWLQITSGAGGTNDGTVTCSLLKNSTTDFRNGTIRITADGAAGSPVDVTVTQSPASTACTATITSTDDKILLDLPYLAHVDSKSGTQPIWAKYELSENSSYPGLIIFKYIDHGVLDNPSFSCTPSTITNDFKIHIPDVLLPDETSHLWIDLEYSPVLSTDGSDYYIVTNFG